MQQRAGNETGVGLRREERCCRRDILSLTKACTVHFFQYGAYDWVSTQASAALIGVNLTDD